MLYKADLVEDVEASRWLQAHQPPLTSRLHHPKKGWVLSLHPSHYSQDNQLPLTPGTLTEADAKKNLHLWILWLKIKNEN